MSADSAVPGAGPSPVDEQEPSPAGLARLVSLTRVPRVAPAAAAATVERTGTAAESLAVLLLVEATTGSLGQAGAVAGAVAASSAVALPLWGRRMDRTSSRAVLRLTAVAFALAGAALTAAAAAMAPSGLLVALGVLLGVAVPPTGPVTKVLWTELFPDPDRRASMHALDSSLAEGAFIAAPLVVAAAAVLGGGVAAMVATTALVSLGAAALAVAVGPRSGRGADTQADERPRLSAVLGSPPLRRLTLAAALHGVLLGAVEVGVVGAGTAGGAEAGVVLALWSLGALVGGLAYGSRTWPGSVSAQLGVVAALQAPPVLLAALLAPAMVPLAVVLTVGGVVLTPFAALAMTEVGDRADRATEGEAFATVSAALLAGAALGTPAAGVLAEAGGSSAPFALAAAAAVLGALPLAGPAVAAARGRDA